MVAWSTIDKSANVALSGGNLVATFTSATQGAVRCDTSFTGKLYFEALISVSSSFWSVGWANATASLAAQIGSTANSVASRPFRADSIFNNITTAQNDANGFSAPLTARIAIDTTALLFWVALDDSFWNNSKTADPATGTGGISLAALGAGPYFPIFGAAASGSSCTARFGASSMWFAPPTGFSTLDTNVQAFMGSSKFTSVAIFSTPRAALSLSKLNSFSILSTPQNALSVSKIVSFAILQPPPINGRFDYNWPLPRVRWPRPFLERNGSVGTNPNLFQGTASGLPPGQQLNDNFAPRRKRFQDHHNPHVIHPTTLQFSYLLFASL